jgi:hypothetical protein
MLGVIGIGLIWAPLWIVMFFVLFIIISVLVNTGGGSDVGPLTAILIMGWIGFVSGAIFSIIFSFAEKGKAIQNLSLARAGLWGIIGSAVFPVLTQRADQLFWTCPFGAVIAIILVLLARKASISGKKDKTILYGFFLFFVLMFVRNVVNPSTDNQ